MATDPQVILKSKFDPEGELKLISKWLLILPNGSILGFDSERSTSFAQRYHRKQLGLDPWSGQPIRGGDSDG